MTRYCVMSMDQKNFFVWDKKWDEKAWQADGWEQAARDAAKLNELIEKHEKGKRY